MTQKEKNALIEKVAKQANKIRIEFDNVKAAENKVITECRKRIEDAKKEADDNFNVLCMENDISSKFLKQILNGSE
jgi:uncharacterized protein Yka (UPF0111/DUF47 family)